MTAPSVYGLSVSLVGCTFLVRIYGGPKHLGGYVY